MLRLPGAWTWDFWLADDGERHHLFFLFASRALRDQHRRHRNRHADGVSADVAAGQVELAAARDDEDGNRRGSREQHGVVDGSSGPRHAPLV